VRVESGEWRVESGKWKVESGDVRIERTIHHSIDIINVTNYLTFTAMTELL
jgi:hypothetical protein